MPSSATPIKILQPLEMKNIFSFFISKKSMTATTKKLGGQSPFGTTPSVTTESKSLSSSRGAFGLSIESIYGLKTPGLFFDSLREQFYQNDELLPINETNTSDGTISVKTDQGVKKFPSKLLQYWESGSAVACSADIYQVKHDVYEIKHLDENEICEMLGINDYSDPEKSKMIKLMKMFIGIKNIFNF
jgi:hypothetical protein